MNRIRNSRQTSVWLWLAVVIVAVAAYGCGGGEAEPPPDEGATAQAPPGTGGPPPGPPQRPAEKPDKEPQPEEEPLPEDVSEWVKEHYYQARKKGDPRLCEAACMDPQLPLQVFTELLLLDGRAGEVLAETRPFKQLSNVAGS